VPNAAVLVATVIPASLVIAVSDMSGLADLYAVGVVGAIATNSGQPVQTGNFSSRPMNGRSCLSPFGIMALIEISLFIDKPNARIFAFTVLAIGLILRD